MRGDSAIDVFLRESFERKDRLAYDWERSYLGRIITLVGAADELITRAECAGYFGSGGEEADNAGHAPI
ncbi:MAG: hypothetical protein AUG74_01275 [Bacteroidetes bacterium 13_1_20CM_4_60_6]|nr:MAG: hypothetical protein AUG74_01275 [Bacteroidetes bacterium 13_1_20CM_4_60_6]